MRYPSCSFPLTLLAAAALVACGGDDPAPAAAMIRGTVAVGAAVGSAEVSVTDTAGDSACAEAAVTTDAAGEFACTLKDGASAPFLLLATDASGGTQPMVSATVRTPTAGQTEVVNITPLTTAIVAQLSADDSALALLADPALLDTAKLEIIKTKVLAQLAPVLAALGLPADYDPFATSLAAATPDSAGDPGDRLIETLRISSVDGQLVMSTVDQPDAVVAVADADTDNAATVAAPAAAGTDLQAGLRRMARILNECFALPVAERVLAVDDGIPLSAGGPEVTDTAAACDGIADDDAYRNGGYRIGQNYHRLLTDPEMDGAVFSVPELMLLLPNSLGAGAHRAIVNLRYRDAKGTAGNAIDVVRLLTRDEADVGAAGDWVLYGNQQEVSSSIQPALIRREQLALGAGSGSGPFGGAAYSRFETALNVFVDIEGPGSDGLRAARVKGPGLPTAGLVMTRLDPAVCSSQNWMNVRRKDGMADPASATPSGNAGNRFVLQRSKGLDGSDATTRHTNPFEGSGNNTQFVNWAHPLDYGKPAGSSDYIDFGQLRAMTLYTLELYYDGEDAPRHTYDKRILSAVMPATSAVAQQWVLLDAAARRLLDPANALAAAADTLALSWVPNPLAEPVRSAGVYTGSRGVAVNQGAVPVTLGEHSAVAQAPSAAACAAGTQFPALSDDGSSWRNIQLRMRTSNASSKDSFTQYN